MKTCRDPYTRLANLTPEEVEDLFGELNEEYSEYASEDFYDGEEDDEDGW